MSLRQPAVLVAFDAGSVAGARVARGLGARRLQSFAQVALTPGALVPSPHEPNLQRTDEVAAAIAQVVRTLAAPGARVRALLPDGIARVALLEANDGALDPAEYARYRLAPGLPYPAREAVVQAERVGDGRVLAAVAWRTVIAEYEQALASAGLGPASIDLTPLAALAALADDARGPAASALIVLGDAAYSLALHVGRRLRVVRSRRRDRAGGEAARLAREVERAARLAEHADPVRVRLVGSGASALAREMAAEGALAEPGWRLDAGALPLPAAELAWLGSALA
jgi:Tfp pilus assembly PilM family ATPase